MPKNCSDKRSSDKNLADVVHGLSLHRTLENLEPKPENHKISQNASSHPDPKPERLNSSPKGLDL